MKGTRTRKQEVLDALVSANGAWIDGSKLATPEVGGSEGLKRLRELRSEGFKIQERRHPDPERAVWQYRLLPADATGWKCVKCGDIPSSTLSASFSPRVMFGECNKDGKQMFTRP